VERLIKPFGSCSLPLKNFAPDQCARTVVIFGGGLRQKTNWLPNAPKKTPRLSHNAKLGWVEESLGRQQGPVSDGSK